ncbi:hypothetical protein AYI85_01145 [Shewanella algae]|nr:hypothetical protein AYI85_01145 [Shewanella algae]
MVITNFDWALMGISKPSQGCVKHQNDMAVLYSDFKWRQRLLCSKVDFEHQMVVIIHDRISANVDAEY